MVKFGDLKIGQRFTLYNFIDITSLNSLIEQGGVVFTKIGPDEEYDNAKDSSLVHWSLDQDTEVFNVE